MVLKRTPGNTASLCKIEVVEVGDVESIPLIYNGRVLNQVTLKSGKSWTEIYHTTDTAHFVERPVVVNGAEAYESIVKWRVPRSHWSTLGVILPWKGKRFLARITDMNRARLLMGSIEEPCRLVHTLRDKGQNIQDSHHINLEIKLTTTEVVPYFTA